MKKALIFLFLIGSLVFFALMIFVSSPYRELRPYDFWGKKISADKGIQTKTINQIQTVLIPGSDKSDPFYIEQIPITVGAYKRCTTSGFCLTQHYARYNYANFYYDNIYNGFPMSFVTFEEARTYCRSYGGDLPTGEQWLMAAGTGDYSWGDQYPTLSRANIDGYYQWQTPSGWLPNGANPYGLLDMSGNVREWILDANPQNNSERGLKGGAFQDDFHAARNDNIFYHESTSSGFNRGFRCAYPTDLIP